MSRGLGRVERLIIDEIKAKGFCCLRDVPALQPAVSRSAKRLVEKNLAISHSYNVSLPCKKFMGRVKRNGYWNPSVVILFPVGLTDTECQKIREINNRGAVRNITLKQREVRG